MATGVENLEAYKSAFWLAMNIFETSKKFPKEEKYSLTDQMENTETQVWLKFALECKYIDFEVYEEFLIKSKEVGRIINYMILNPKKFGITRQATTNDQRLTTND